MQKLVPWECPGVPFTTSIFEELNEKSGLLHKSCSAWCPEKYLLMGLWWWVFQKWTTTWYVWDAWQRFYSKRPVVIYYFFQHMLGIFKIVNQKVKKHFTNIVVKIKSYLLERYKHLDFLKEIPYLKCFRGKESL